MRSNHWSVVARIWQALRGLLFPIHYDSSSHGSLDVMLVMMCEELDPPADPPNGSKARAELNRRAALKRKKDREAMAYGRAHCRRWQVRPRIAREARSREARRAKRGRRKM